MIPDTELKHKYPERFFSPIASYSLRDLAHHAGFFITQKPSEDYMIHEVQSLQKAQKNHITFFENRRYLHLLHKTQAGACLVRAQDQHDVPKHTIPLITPAPYRAYALVVQHLYPDVGYSLYPAEIHSTAQIHPSASLGQGCRVGAYTVIGENAVIGSETYIGSHSMVGSGCCIGEQCRIESHVSLVYSILGNRVHIHAGARIGQSGFGFHMSAQGFTSIPHLGRVLIHDDVRIGANTTVDRGSLEDTVIGQGSMVDNLVQIAHNVSLGPRCVLAGQVGLAGSAHLEAGCVLGGQSGVNGHVSVGQGTQLAAQSGIVNDTPARSILAGFPAEPIREWKRWIALKKRWVQSQVNSRHDHKESM